MQSSWSSGSPNEAARGAGGVPWMVSPGGPDENIAAIPALSQLVDPAGSLVLGAEQPITDAPAEALIPSSIGSAPLVDNLQILPAATDSEVEPNAVPEPGGLALLGLGLVALAFARRAR